MEIKPQTDAIQVHIEDDGTITVVTGKMAPEVHHTAEEFLHEVTRVMGGERKTEQLERSHHVLHTHSHNHEHLKQKG